MPIEALARVDIIEFVLLSVLSNSHPINASKIKDEKYKDKYFIITFIKFILLNLFNFCANEATDWW